MWIDNTIKFFKLLNDYYDVDRNIFFELKDGSITRMPNAA